MYSVFRTSVISSVLAIFLITTAPVQAQQSPCDIDNLKINYPDNIEISIDQAHAFQPKYYPTASSCDFYISDETFTFYVKDGVVTKGLAFTLPDDGTLSIKAGEYVMWATAEYTFPGPFPNLPYPYIKGTRTIIGTLSVLPLNCSSDLKLNLQTKKASFTSFASNSCQKVSESFQITGASGNYQGADWGNLNLPFGSYSMTGTLRYRHQYPGADTQIREIKVTKTFTVQDDTPPQISFLTPTPQSTISGTETITAVAQDASGIKNVSFYLVGSPNTLLGTDTTAPYSINFDTTKYADASIQIMAVARDKSTSNNNAGNTASATATYVINNFNAKPTFRFLTSGLSGPLKGTVDIRYSSYDLEGIESIKFYVDGSLFKTATTKINGTNSFSLDTRKFQDGLHTISGILLDTDQEPASDAFSIEFRNTIITPPQAESFTPASGTVVHGTFTAELQIADTSNVRGVKFKLNNRVFGTVTVAPYRSIIDTSFVADGVHALTATIEDTAGNTTVKTSNIIVKNQSSEAIPVVTLLSPADGSEISETATISLAALDDVAVDRVDLYIDNTFFDTKLLPPYTFQVDTTALADGQHLFQAEAKDYSSNTGTREFTLIVNNAEPAPQLIGSQSGSAQELVRQKSLDVIREVTTVLTMQVQEFSSGDTTSTERITALRDMLKKLITMIEESQALFDIPNLKKMPKRAKKMKRKVSAVYRKKNMKKARKLRRMQRKALRSMKRFLKILDY